MLQWDKASKRRLAMALTCFIVWVQGWKGQTRRQRGRGGRSLHSNLLSLEERLLHRWKVNIWLSPFLHQAHWLYRVNVTKVPIAIYFNSTLGGTHLDQQPPSPSLPYRRRRPQISCTDLSEKVNVSWNKYPYHDVQPEWIRLLKGLIIHLTFKW